MSSLTLALIGLAALVLLVGYVLYAQALQKRNKARRAFSTIDVQLKKRRDLIPNVLSIAKETMTREIELLEKVTRLRQAAAEDADPSDPDAVRRHLSAERELGMGVRRLFAVAESYPEPRFVEAMKRAQATYEEVEGHIAASRRFYNASVEDLQNAVEIWPSSMIARMAGVKPMPFFEIDDEEREPIHAADVFAG